MTIGAANAERLLVLDPASFGLGRKCTVTPRPLGAGGSGLNVAARLLATGHAVFPILPVAPDGTGQALLQVLHDAAERGGQTVNVESFMMDGDTSTTPLTTILVLGDQRTVLSEFPDAIVREFVVHWRRRLARLGPVMPSAVVIGHIHADRPTSEQGQSGGISQAVIEMFAERGIPIFVNFGASQYTLGIARWSHLLDRVACLQLDIDEARRFVHGEVRPTLHAMLDWFRDRCTVVITLERLGAVAQFRGSDSVIFAWPYDLPPDVIADTTGAGDAFVAGVVSSALDVPLEDEDALLKAVEKGRLWASYACTTFGGANDCPTHEQLAQFPISHSLLLQSERRRMSEAVPLLRILDRSFASTAPARSPSARPAG
ncbi:MAG TPA: carbohydrate kinase family protein [Dehalococcoidia bacterium]|nr:carbohydrate kinase family protein [Dehalococcoidia bacterium]